MDTRHFIAVDMGATSGRVILASIGADDFKTEVLHRFRTPLVEIGGRYCWNIYSIYEDMVKGLTIAGSRGIKVESIGIDTWGVDIVGVERDGSLCGLPRSYRDPYTRGVQERFFKKVPATEMYGRTGINPADYNTIFQLYALRREKSSMLRHARWLLFMPDALGYLLTGERYCEYTIASTSGMLDPVRKKFDKEILSVCKLSRRRFPSIVQPGRKVGRLTDALARKTGLGRIPVVAVAGHDTASAIAGIPASGREFALLSSGTWSIMGIEMDHPVTDARAAGMQLTNEGGVDGTTCLLRNHTGMWILEQCLDRWRRDDKDYSYADVTRMAESCAPSPRVIDIDDPAFSAPTDMPAAIEAWCIAHDTPVPVDDAHMIRLIYDSMADKYAGTLANLREIATFPINTLNIIGGGAQNDFLNQLTADRCDVTVLAGPYEATAIGNVMLQARAAGMFRSLQDIRDYVRRHTGTRMFTPRRDG